MGRPKQEHRGVVLPEYMTPACLDELATLLNMHCHEDNDETNEEAAARAFAIVLRHLSVDRPTPDPTPASNNKIVVKLRGDEIAAAWHLRDCAWL